MGSLSGADSRRPNPVGDIVAQPQPVLPNALGRRAIVIFPRQLVRVQPHEMRAARAEIGTMRWEWRTDRDFVDPYDERSVAARHRGNLKPLLVQLGTQGNRMVSQDGAEPLAQIEAARSRSDSGIPRLVPAEVRELPEATSDVFCDHADLRFL